MAIEIGQVKPRNGSRTMEVGQYKSGNWSRAIELGQWKADNGSSVYAVELLEDLFGYCFYRSTDW